MKTILLVANWESGVGYAWWLMENFWIQIARAFSSKGYEIILLYPKITEIPVQIQKSKIRVIELDYNEKSVSSLFKLSALIKKHSVRTIYLTDKPFFEGRYILFHLLGVKNIFVHDHTPGERQEATGIKKVFKNILNRLPLLPADHLFAVTKYVQARFIKTYCWPKEKCSVVQNGIVPYELNSKNRNYAHKEFGIPEEGTIVISTGRAIKYKNVDFIIRCANELINNRNHSELYFIYCGDGPDIEYFRNTVNEYHLNNNFIFSGNRKDIPELLQSAKFGLHSSKGEVGYSLSILEFMSAGLITLVPNNPSVCGSIDHSVTGYIYAPDNITEVADIIEACKDNNEQSDIIKKNAINSVKEKYNLSKTNEALIYHMNRVMK